MTPFQIENARNVWVATTLGIGPVYRDDNCFVAEVGNGEAVAVFASIRGKEVLIDSEAANEWLVPDEFKLGLAEPMQPSPEYEKFLPRSFERAHDADSFGEFVSVAEGVVPDAKLDALIATLFDQFYRDPEVTITSSKHATVKGWFNPLMRFDIEPFEFAMEVTVE